MIKPKWILVLAAGWHVLALPALFCEPLSESEEVVEAPNNDLLDPQIHGPEGRKAWHSVESLEKAAFYHQEGDLVLAERLYIEILESEAPDEDKKTALVELAEVYHDRGIVSKAVDTLETFLRNYPEVSDRPELYFRLGELYREMDLSDESITMFYRVLNSIVVTGETNLQKYLGLARLAQFEIARCHYEQGGYERAFLLFDRIELLELNMVDRETVSYYKTLASVRAGNHDQGLSLLRRFVRDFPESEYVPEILYLEAEVLYHASRVQDSADALLRLLETVKTSEKETSTEWIFWRQKAGNRLANRFYDDGNFLVALRIYQGMVFLDPKPTWQLPLVYQIGLCFEKLSMFERARESYRYINDQLETVTEVESQPILANLGESASWRLELLNWRNELSEKVGHLVVNTSLKNITTDPES